VVVGKSLSAGPLGPLAIACAVVVLLFGTAAPALADDPPTSPRAAPAPRAARPAPNGASYQALITHANEAARDLTALQQQARDVAAARTETLAQMSAIDALTERPSKVRDRVERQALRLSVRDELPSAAVIPTAVREAAQEMRTLRTQLKEQYVALETEAQTLAPYAVAPSGAWTSPLQGEITQGFGPTDLWFEPAREHGGVFYPHFHEGVDIGAEMYSPVVAAAAGHVVWVGRLPDGAMVVLIAHVGGLVSLYAHLDDHIAPPSVATGAEVNEGQTIGAVGMTGLTTGPHLHFVVWRNGELIDPLSLIAH
jgi:murein DD-endopeptidase MepM/ murein hydrolase activator NlpD